MTCTMSSPGTTGAAPQRARCTAHEGAWIEDEDDANVVVLGKARKAVGVRGRDGK
jgi:hypothetical protein